MSERKEEKKYARLYITIPVELNEELRRFLPMRKGELSKFIAEAIKEKLEREKQREKTWRSPGGIEA